VANYAELVTDWNGLGNPHAGALVKFVERYGDGVADVVELRRNDGGELVILDICTGSPQEPVHPIRRVERVGVLFGRGSMPLMVMLRDDFPDTEHQMLVPRGHPAAICIDDRPWAEASLGWTPAELVTRVLSWFERASVGKLHDTRQPLDPVFLLSEFSFVTERSVWDEETTEVLIAEQEHEHSPILRVKRLQDCDDTDRPRLPICVMTYRLPAQGVRPLRHMPVNLYELSTILGENGIVLVDDLNRLLSDLLTDAGARWLLNSLLAVMVQMPVRASPDVLQDGADLRAFVSERTVGEIGVVLGIALKDDRQLQDGTVGYVKHIRAKVADASALKPVAIECAEVHLEFEHDLAARLAGRDEPDSRHAVLIGAGALGSALADCLAREGRFTWTVIDPDRMLPHNLARHIGHNDRIGYHKAHVLADHLNAVVAEREAIARALPNDLFAGGEPGRSISSAMAAADLIVDATASIGAARRISDHEGPARRISTFFNPSGAAAVLLAEPADRALTLRDLEAQYYRLVLETGSLKSHLDRSVETFAYTGGCRAISNRFPQSNVSVLAGLVAMKLGDAVDQPEAVLAVWTLDSNGEVTLDTAPPDQVTRYLGKNDWKITTDAGFVRQILAMRKEKLPVETGGMLFGVVDVPARSICLVHAAAAPDDSIESIGGFERGVRGVGEYIDRIRRRTSGQVRYVGEWHSHPPGASGQPSPRDIRQIDWLAAVMEMDSAPALMVIATDIGIEVIFAEQGTRPLALTPRDGRVARGLSAG